MISLTIMRSVSASAPSSVRTIYIYIYITIVVLHRTVDSLHLILIVSVVDPISKASIRREPPGRGKGDPGNRDLGLWQYEVV